MKRRDNVVMGRWRFHEHIFSMNEMPARLAAIWETAKSEKMMTTMLLKEDHGCLLLRRERERES
jgi:hypothetical protein